MPARWTWYPLITRRQDKPIRALSSIQRSYDGSSRADSSPHCTKIKPHQFFSQLVKLRKITSPTAVRQSRSFRDRGPNADRRTLLSSPEAARKFVFAITLNQFQLLWIVRRVFHRAGFGVDRATPHFAVNKAINFLNPSESMAGQERMKLVSVKGEEKK